MQTAPEIEVQLTCPRRQGVFAWQGSLAARQCEAESRRESWLQQQGASGCAHLPAGTLLVEALHLAGPPLLGLQLQQGRFTEDGGPLNLPQQAEPWARKCVAHTGRAQTAICRAWWMKCPIGCLNSPPAPPHLLPQRSVLRLQRRDLHLCLRGLLLQRRQAGHRIGRGGGRASRRRRLQLLHPRRPLLHLGGILRHSGLQSRGTQEEKNNEP